MSPNWVGDRYACGAASWEARNPQETLRRLEEFRFEVAPEPVRWRSQPWRVARLIFCSLLVGVVVGVLVGTVLL